MTVGYFTISLVTGAEILLDGGSVRGVVVGAGLSVLLYATVVGALIVLLWTIGTHP